MEPEGIHVALGGMESVDQHLFELEHLYKTAPIGLCLIDRELRFVRINERLAEINGRSVSEHIGRTLSEVIPEIAPKVEPLYRRVIETGEPIIDVEVRGTTPPAPFTEKFWLVSHYPLKAGDGTVKGVSTVVQDITKRKRAEEERRKSEERLRVLLETTNVIPWEADAETWQFTYVGPQAVRLLGFPVDRWYEEGFWASHIHPEDRESAVDFCGKSSRSGKDHQFEYRMISSEGKIVWLHDLVSVESTGGSPKILRGFMVDITDRKRAELLQAGQKRVLEMLIKDEPIEVVLGELARTMDNLQTGMRCSILQLDREGKRLLPVVGPRLPEEFKKFLDGMEFKENPCPCLRAAFLGKRAVVTDTLTDPRCRVCRDLVRRSHLRACWSQPILSRSGQVLGAFAVYYDRPYRPTDSEIGMIEQAACFAGVTIERARVSEDLKESESALRKSQEALQDFAGKILSAQEAERRRLARELHDDLTQRLAALAIEAGKLEKRNALTPAQVSEGFREMKDRIVELSEDIHGISRQLHPSIIDDLGLVDAIASECARFSAREGVPVRFMAEGVPGSVSKDISLCLYRVLQESLRNIARHSRAKEARVTLTGVGGGLHLSIQDSGVGFDPARVRGKGGLGLASMEERVRLVHGRLSVESRPGEGTLIEVRAPLVGTDR